MGGMAEIYLARQSGLEGFEKKLVVKRILPHLAENEDFVKMFLHEAKVAARLNHANIAQIFDLGREETTGSYYIAMEYIHGEDLRRISKQAEAQGRDLPVGLVMRMVADACAGLDYAHKRADEQGRPLDIVHRDVSPQNILVSFDGSVKVVDFGIAKAADQATVTRSGVLKGKYSYMSPEQAAGQRVDCRTDVFAIGVVLWELLTGTRLFKRASDVATLNAVAECRVDPPSSANPRLPPSVDVLVMRALTRDPNERFQEAVELQVAIEDWLVRNQQAASSAHLAAFMQDLYAERLADESRLSESGVGRSVLSQSLQALREEDGRRPSGPKARLVSRQEDVGPRDATSALRPSRVRSGSTPSLRAQAPTGQPVTPRVGRPRLTQEMRRPMTPPPVEFDDEDELDIPTNPMNASEVAAATRAHGLTADGTRSISSTEDSPPPHDTQSRAPAERIARPSRASRAPRPSGEHHTGARAAPRAESQRQVPVAVTDFTPVPDEPRSRKGLWIALVAVLVIGAALAVAFATGGEAPAPVLRFTSSPAGATVLAAGQTVCPATPCEVAGLTPGTATLSVRLEGHTPKDVVVGVPRSGTLEIPTVTLEPVRAPVPPVQPQVAPKAPGGPSLSVRSTPPGAQVFLDGRSLGRTPLLLTDAQPGEHALRVESDGYRAHEEQLTLVAGATLERELALEKIVTRTTPTRPRSEPRASNSGGQSGEKGVLTFFVKPWAEVQCNSHDLGSTPFPPKELPVGVYRCTFTNPRFDPVVRTIRVTAGKNPVVKVNFE